MEKKNSYFGCRSAKGRRRGEQGFSLILLTVSLIVIVGMLGLTFDLGRMYITKNELQTFADSAALASVFYMNGTQQGIQAANAMATIGPLGSTTPNAFNFGTNAVSNVTVTYASQFTGQYDSYAQASTASTNSYRFIKVTATAGISLDFLPVLPGIPTVWTATASAVAGQKENDTTNNLAPFMPDGHNMADTTNFGFTVGQEYTLKWGNGGTTCAGDAGFVDPDPSSQHGFVNLGQGNANSALRNAIIYGADPTSPIDVGSLIPGVPGNRGTTIFGALSSLAAQDTDDTSTYPAYLTSLANGTANGRRIITVAIGNPSTWSGNGNGSEAVAGFGNFLLDPAYSGTSGAICATYLGPANANGVSSGGSDGTKVYTNVLYQ
ncbi:MAG TPA: pilus assembly protein TadG-related protein [Bryobacteraceae bacterium]|nr:pilus assembly protein TadG-related protein [Bryobacteraceae bacterium]